MFQFFLVVKTLLVILDSNILPHLSCTPCLAPGFQVLSQKSQQPVVPEDKSGFRKHQSDLSSVGEISPSKQTFSETLNYSALQTSSFPLKFLTFSCVLTTVFSHLSPF